MTKSAKRICLLILVSALFLIVVGVIDGGFADTLRRGQLICYECMGIG